MFGSIVIYNSLEKYPQLDGVVLIAPPIAIETNRFQTRVDVIVGDNDAFCSIDKLVDLRSESGRVQLHIIEGADHFFTGRLDELADTIEAILTRNA